MHEAQQNKYTNCTLTPLPVLRDRRVWNTFRRQSKPCFWVVWDVLYLHPQNWGRGEKFPIPEDSPGHHLKLIHLSRYLHGITALKTLQMAPCLHPSWGLDSDNVTSAILTISLLIILGGNVQIIYLTQCAEMWWYTYLELSIVSPPALTYYYWFLTHNDEISLANIIAPNLIPCLPYPESEAPSDYDACFFSRRGDLTGKVRMCEFSCIQPVRPGLRKW